MSELSYPYPESSAQALACFKAYDVRGRVPDDLNETIAYRLGMAFAQASNRKPACQVRGSLPEGSAAG